MQKQDLVEFTSFGFSNITHLVLSMYQKQELCVDRVVAHEMNISTKYDYIINTREDIFFFNMSLSLYNLTQRYFYLSLSLYEEPVYACIKNI